METHTERGSRKEGKGLRCPPHGYPPINEGKDIPPIKEEREKSPLWA